MEIPRNVAYLVGLHAADLRAIVENVMGNDVFACNLKPEALAPTDERHVAGGIPACSNQRTRQPGVLHAQMDRSLAAAAKAIAAAYPASGAAPVLDDGALLAAAASACK
ncbi:hypothetical protein [Xanthomonas arboricola]|uniref:Uncharacterized protein n=2 Tax=Xanthomonas arboricola TaxID=56448 RepID=A0A2S7A5P4_9XANT|nr:hypothetical protein [Xanthomonas arboricola]PPU02778.1 hypothetical protein XarbCFBP7409_04290 [Xanthomonas arboricola pv. guizotiae]PPU25262.1 hypothetical protein XarbCFBP7408_05895 [Xanthomonas arboricola pv. guizotiae]